MRWAQCILAPRQCSLSFCMHALHPNWGGFILASWMLTLRHTQTIYQGQHWVLRMGKSLWYFTSSQGCQARSPPSPRREDLGRMQR
ncbi:hypothetical protein B0T16DRAFT_411050 [Cercophora newfieldiana]|uniref:Uncharacterized protein n=1 Tax=Cercophora newfieldiana TaxID=92897 RepID=A0AA39YDQ4_9PEZI|nr:hypothetical protein B0T16DRAFT_411050 [Cercophora newfieldiana]